MLGAVPAKSPLQLLQLLHSGHPIFHYTVQRYSTIHRGRLQSAGSGGTTENGRGVSVHSLSTQRGCDPPGSPIVYARCRMDYRLPRQGLDMKLACPAWA